MSLIYATTADLTAWMQPTSIPTNATQLLRTASMAVREATESAFYAADTTGMPTDPVILQAFKDATCAQAAALATQDINPLAGGALLDGVESSVGLLSGRITYAGTDQVLSGKKQVIGGLVREAYLILRQAGIILNTPWVVG